MAFTNWLVRTWGDVLVLVNDLVLVRPFVRRNSGVHVVVVVIEWKVVSVTGFNQSLI